MASLLNSTVYETKFGVRNAMLSQQAPNITITTVCLLFGCTQLVQYALPKGVQGNPQDIHFGSGRITRISAGEKHSIALHENSSMWCWGANDIGQLGNSFFIPPVTAPPMCVGNECRKPNLPAATIATDVAADGCYVLALVSNPGR